MVLTPVEIEAKEFSRVLRGYNSEEVDRFIQKILKDYEVLFRENQELKEEIERAKESLKKYEELEKTINETLVMAQKSAEDLKNNAVKEAELIVREAENRAGEIIAQAVERAKKQEAEYEEIARQYRLFAAEFKSLLLTHLEMLDKNMNKNTDEEADFKTLKEEGDDQEDEEDF